MREKKIWSLKLKRPEAFIDKTLQSPAFPFSSQTIIFERGFKSLLIPEKDEEKKN